MPKARQFTIQAGDRPGLLGEVAAAVWHKGVNIEALLAAVHQGQAVIRLVVDKPAAARRALSRSGWRVREEDVVTLVLHDRPGVLAALASRLGQAGISIEYVYTGPARMKGKIKTYLAVSDVPRALKLLR